MRIDITLSGGFAGLPRRRKRIETNELDPRLRAQFEALFTTEALRAWQARSPRGADRLACRIELTDASGSRAAFEGEEGALPPEALDLIDAL